MTKAEFINELIAKVHPWHRLSFVLVNDENIVVRIGGVLCTAKYDFIDHEWQLTSETLESKHFVEHIQKVLQGWTRDDAGVLHVPS